MPRGPRPTPGGYVYHVLNRGNARKSVFDHDGDYAAFEQILAETLTVAPMRILSYVLMPNHWHFVVWPERDGELAVFMQRLTVKHVRRWHEYRGSTGTGHVYQGTYKSFPVQEDAHFLTVCRYVERNPVRSGLVPRAEEWQWGSLYHRHRGDGLSRLVLRDWPVPRPDSYLDWVNTPQTHMEEEALRRCVGRGMAYGESIWGERVAGLLGLPATIRPRCRPRRAE